MISFTSYFPLMALLAMTLGLAGCATQQSASDRHLGVLARGGLVGSDKIVPRRIGESTAASCTSTPEQDDRLRADYLKTLDACRFVMTGYETESIEAKRQRRWLMIVGAVAGSIVVPSLAAGGAATSGIAGWGGLSGVTNVASHIMETEGLDANFFLGTRENVRKSLDAGIKKFIGDESDYCTRRNAVAEMAAACTSYSVSMPPKVESK